MKSLRSKGSLLLVDDNVELLDSLHGFFREHFDVLLLADRGQKALELLSLQSVDCVVTDFQMPGMNGLDLIKRIRKSHPEVQFILMTGNGSHPDLISYRKEKMGLYIDKPFSNSELLDLIIATMKNNS